MHNRLVIILLTYLLGFLSFSQSTKNQLDFKLNQLYEKSQLPGFAVAIVNKDSLLYTNGLGFENIEKNEHFSIDKRFNIASISKTFTALSLMKLIEEHKINLQTPINDVLPFKVINPKFPNSKITLLHLVTHTSSINDADIESKSWYIEEPISLTKKTIGKEAFKVFNNWVKNEKTTLGNFLKDALNTQGNYFSKKRFLNHKPGDDYSYSNIGAALVAYIIELKSGKPYSDMVTEILQKDFNINGEIWKHQLTKQPTSYFQNKTEIPVYKPILYPTGGMMLSTVELAKYLKEMIKGYCGESELLLKTSFEAMMSKQKINVSNHGILWKINGDIIFHNGGNYGVITLMSFNKKTGIGKVLLTNISSYENDKLLKEVVKIWKELSVY